MLTPDEDDDAFLQRWPVPDGIYLCNVKVELLRAPERTRHGRAAWQVVDQVVSAAQSVIRDTLPPDVVVIAPADGASVSDAAITVIGTVVDLTATTVSVNNVHATITNGGFVASLVPAEAGPNTLVVVAMDEAGNSTTQTLTVWFDDDDRDGIADELDKCPTVFNPDQLDEDADGLGDLCDPCPLDAVPDLDGDGICSFDNCPMLSNPGQEDEDRDSIGDACDSCPDDPTNDVDGDGICDDVDNCYLPNKLQTDADHNGVGDPCDAVAALEGQLAGGQHSRGVQFEYRLYPKGGLSYLGGANLAPSCVVPEPLTVDNAKAVVGCFLEHTEAFHSIEGSTPALGSIELRLVKSEANGYSFIKGLQRVVAIDSALGPAAPPSPDQSTPPTVTGTFGVEAGEFVVSIRQHQIVQYQGRLFEAAKLPPSSACLPDGQSAPCLVGVSSESDVVAKAMTTLGPDAVLVGRAYSTELEGLVAHLLLANGRDVAVIDESTGQVVRTYGTSKGDDWVGTTAATYYAPIVKSGVSFDPTIALPTREMDGGVWACMDRINGQPSMGVDSLDPQCFEFNPFAANLSGLPLQTARAVSLYFWAGDQVGFVNSDNASYSSAFSFDEQHGVHIGLFTDGSSDRCGGEKNTDGCAFPRPQYYLAHYRWRSGDYKIYLLDRSYPSGWTHADDTLNLLVHEYGHVVSFMYGFFSSADAVLDEGWADHHVLRYVLFRANSMAERPWDSAFAAPVYDTDLSARRPYRHDSDASHGYDAAKGFQSYGHFVPGSSRDASLFYSPFSYVCDHFIASVTSTDDTYSKYNCGAVLSEVYWELAFNVLRSGYEGYQKGEKIVQAPSADPLNFVNSAFTYAITSISGSADIRDFFNAVESWYYPVTNWPDYWRVKSVLNHHCVGWDDGCDDRPWQRVIPEGLPVASLNKSLLATGVGQSELLLVRDLPDRSNFSAKRIDDGALLCSQWDAIEFEADIPSYGRYVFEVSHAGPLTFDGNLNMSVDPGPPGPAQYVYQGWVVKRNYLLSRVEASGKIVPIPTSSLTWDALAGGIVLSAGRHVFKIQSNRTGTGYDCVMVSAVAVRRDCDVQACAGRCNTVAYDFACAMGNVTCGDCSAGWSCVSNVCVCVPQSCPAGWQCGGGSDGCGGTFACSSCAAGSICMGDHTCCKPKTCADYGLTCYAGQHDDGCGGVFSCPCAAGQSCCAHQGSHTCIDPTQVCCGPCGFAHRCVPEATIGGMAQCMDWAP